jgi:hypothetical protein
MSYIRGIKAYKIFNLLYLTKTKNFVKNYFPPIFHPNPDIEKRLASSREDLETFSGPRALVCLSRFLIPIQLNQSPISLCNSLSLGTDYPLVLSPPSVFGSVFTRLDINSVQRTSV